MFLWLKLLVFGLALVDVDVFINGQATTTSFMKTTDGKPTPDLSLIPSRTTPFSPASTFEAEPGSTTKETVPPPASRAVNSTEPSPSEESVAFTATSASLTISATDLPNNSFLTTQTDSRASNISTNSSAAAIPSPFPFARTHAPTDDGNTFFLPTTGIATSISSAPPNTTSIGDKPAFIYKPL
ncbi:receptor-type tyrosine-protein phosphatase C-like isoform X1 [Candoia aspera]|uniref:receptor-type tyrosine-protein phosphatase C-like isoform X1 n=1 Tax=Candoia aspera TaxID=51853 RepID=UPI002FD83A3C